MSKMRMTKLSEWRRSFRYRVVACFGIGLVCQAAFSPLAAASTAPGPATDRAPPAQNGAISAGTSPDRAASTKAAGSPKEGVARPDDAVPELWTPRAAVLVDTNSPLGAESLFDGDGTTGFTTEKGGGAAVRVDLGSVREVVGIGVHGAGRAKIAIYAEDNGARRLISTGRDGALNLASDQWAQVVPAALTKASALVVQWTASPTAATTVTELALWVAGRSRSALAEATITDRLVTELPENAVAATAVPWTASVARVTPQGSVSASFAVRLNLEPRLGRAFLVYELDKKAHWTGVARSINGHVVRGGYRAEAKGLGGVQVEEINPVWLRSGDNTIVFQPTLTEDGRGYSIRNVRVVSVPRGVDAVPAPGARSPLSDGDLATGVGGPGVHGASVSTRADREPAFLSFHLDKPTRGTLTVSANGAQARRNGKVQVDLDGRSAGWQTVPIAGALPTSSELRVRVLGDRESTGKVSEARILGFPALVSHAELAMSYPLHGECHDHKIYVRGFVSGPSRLQKPQVFVDGAPTSGKIDPDGSFEVDVQEPATARGKPWSVRLEVAAEGGGRLGRTVPVDTCVEPPKKRIIGVSPPVEDVGAPYGAVVSPAKASTLSFAGAKIEIPAGAVESDVRVTIRALDPGRLPPVQAEMDNVSTGGGALRFGPHGLTFKKPVTVTLPIDAARMPPGMTSGDVVAFFFDEASGKWAQLPKVFSRSDRVAAETTHFTDFIASTVRTPDHPEAQQFNPNTMKGVKAGEPGAGITMIEPPVANSSGSASLSYPIETPPGRNGIGPSLALTYDSERVNANGWLGVGWDLRMSSIEIDTRWGVPKYDGSEIYLLDGAPLAWTGNKYVRRVESSFDHIERIGTGPTNYSWKVMDKNGTRYTYGTVANSRLANPRTTPPVAGTSMAPQGAIFRWYLEKVEDTFGNYMTITYLHDNTSPMQTENVDGVYPLVIHYTAHTGGLAPNYHVEFKLDTLPPPPAAPLTPTRPDRTINARPGFVEVIQRLLTDITVKSGTTVVRQYHFDYQTNLTDTMQKSVLSAVALWGPTGASSELYRHTFEYNKAPALSWRFGTQQPWGTVVKAAPPGQSGTVPRTERRLSHSVDSLGGGNVLVGVGFPSLNATYTKGGDLGSSVTDLAFFGLTGEGLPDQVDTAGILSLNVLRNVPPGGFQFVPSNVTGLMDLGATRRFGFTTAGSVSALDIAFGASVSHGRHTSTEFGLITDINGDGFPDVAYQSGNKVIARVNDRNRNFVTQEWTNYVLDNAPFSTADRVTQAAAAQAFFKTDPLIRWVAPFTGTVTVNATAELQSTSLDDMRVDLYVAPGPNQNPTGSVTLTNSDTGTLASNLVRTVNAGDRIYIRVVNLDQGSVVNPNEFPTGNSAALSTSIVYQPPAGRSASELDPTGVPIFNFVDSDFRPAGLPRVPWRLTANGTVAIGRCFKKKPTPDTVTATYMLREANGDPALGYPKVLQLPAAVPDPMNGSTFCFDNLVLPPYPSDPNKSTIAVKTDQTLVLELTSDTPVDPLATRPFPDSALTMSYTWYCRPKVLTTGEICGPPTPQPTGSAFTIGPSDPWPDFPIPYENIIGVGGSGRPHPYRQTHVWQTFNNCTITPNTCATTPPQPIRSVPAPSTSVTFGGSVTTTAPLTEDVLVLIQGVNKLFAKVRIPAGTAMGATFPVTTHSCTVSSDCALGRTCVGALNRQCAGAATVNSGEPIFFTIHSPTVIGGNVTWSPTMNGAAVSQLNINRSILDPLYDNNPRAGVTSRDPMSGGFHRWFSGDWNDSVPFSDSLIVRTPAPPSNNDPVMGGIPVDTFDEDMFAGRGGAKLLLATPGSSTLAQPGRIADPNATATNPSSMQALRVSDTWNVNLSARLQNVNAGVNRGDATTQVDFFDVNGDRYPDSITRGGVQYNDGSSTFSTRQPADAGFGHLRKVVNFSLQAGSEATLGDRQLLNESNGKGHTKKISATTSIGNAADYGVSSTRIDFVDVNGDGLVDHVQKEPGDAAFKVKLNLGYGFSNEVSWETSGWNQPFTTAIAWPEFIAPNLVPDPGAAMNAAPGSPSSTNVVRLEDTGTKTATVGGNLGIIGGGGGPTWSVTRKWVDLIDVNGDGLPDQVLKVPGRSILYVKLNTGNGFAAEESWTLPDWNPPGTALTKLAEFSFLTAGGFGAPDGLGFSTIDGWGANLGNKFCWFVCVGGSGFLSESRGGVSADFEDIDGDGKPDHVMKVQGDAQVFWKENNIGKTNLLSAVNRPLGGRIEISYTRTGNHVDLQSNPKVSMPSNQWVMSRVFVQSGYFQTWNALTRQDFDYSNFLGYGSGFYDPVERENFGFGSVKTKFPFEDVWGTAILTRYFNQNYYLRGLEDGTSWIQDDINFVLLRSTQNSYLDPNPAKNVTTEPPRTGTYFPAPVDTKTMSWETSISGLTHRVSRVFSTGGDLIDVVDYGATEHNDPSDDFNYHITYQTISNPNWTARVPRIITTRTGQVASSGTLLAKRTASFTTQPKPDSVTDVIVGGKNPPGSSFRTEISPANATWTFTYDTWGNVLRATSPNSTTTDPDGSARMLEYGYDATTRTYPVTTSQIEQDDANAHLRYSASADYDLRFGLPIRIVDIAGAKQEIDYDNYGRITKVFAPSDFDASGNRIDTSAPTIDVAYREMPHNISGFVESLPAWAMATHRSSAPPEGSVPLAAVTPRSMRTVNFVDGLNRSIQVQKDITRDNGSGTTTAGMSISGQTIFDARGRVWQQGQPMFVGGTGTPISLVSVPMTNETQFAYDVLGRLRQEQHPDNGTQATTRISYQMGTSPKDGRLYVVKLTTDPLYAQDTSYHYRVEFRNARDELKLLHEVNRINGAFTDVDTQYGYDPLGRVVRVTDATEKVTSAQYDTVGNLVLLTSPDTGDREWRYCVGGYVCGEQSANARNQGSSVRIQYVYDRDRLTSIVYPNPSPNPNPTQPNTPPDPTGNPPVTFVYGTATEKGATAGYKANRVKQRVDEAGTFDYAYDALGNVASETALLKNTIAGGNYLPYQTQYKWDNFGRLIDVTIPGATNEVIRYGYDAGGAVTSAWGKVGSGTPSPYVKHVGYDEFGQRVRITYGNEVFSEYAYAPDTRRLTNANTSILVGGEPTRTQQLFYSYDLVGNVTGREQALPVDTNLANPVPIGGFSSMWFYYDPLNQLTGADLYNQSKSTEQYYASTYITYDKIGNIRTKNQTDSVDLYQPNGTYIRTDTRPGHYVFTPSYLGTTYNGSSPHGISFIHEDRSGTISGRSLIYDRNGNVNQFLQGPNHRWITWTDTDRVRNVCNGQLPNCAPVAQSLYAADGTRTHHKVFQGQSIKETLYVNQHLTVRNGTLPTKHVYLGDARVASKVEGNGAPRTYWYHSDNLQSTQYVTTAGQALVQHLEYFPSGEIWREENGAALMTDFTEHATTFTGKEIDPGTNYYYYGARYYEPQIQMWLSPDPILASYMGGGPSGGVFQPKNLDLYSYAWNNPVGLRDPNGREVVGLPGPGSGFPSPRMPLGAGPGAGPGFGPLPFLQFLILVADASYRLGQYDGRHGTFLGFGGPRQEAPGAPGAGTAYVPPVGDQGPRQAPSANPSNGVGLPSTPGMSCCVTDPPASKGQVSLVGGNVPGPTVDPATGASVGRFVVDSNGNTMIEPAGGRTVPAGRGGVDTHTLYPNGSNYQRLNPHGHANNPTPHGHGHLPGTGPGIRGQGSAIDQRGNVVPWNSPEAHWRIND
jgi:RHS repeat-associated protein